MYQKTLQRITRYFLNIRNRCCNPFADIGLNVSVPVRFSM